jgi:RNA polymerase sigma-70 factor (ECF subfamily)
LEPIPFAAPLAMNPTAPTAVDLGALFERHGRRLYRLARRLSRDAAEAEDLVQETFLRAARSARPLPDESGAAEGWLVRTLVRLAHDRFRRRRVRADATPELARAQESTADPSGAAIARRDVARALAALPPRRRVVVVLHELEERDTAEIARLLGIARVTVRWHLAAGRKELARRLGPSGTEREEAP